MASTLDGYAFITGAASGIGKEVALAYAAAGVAGMYLVDINASDLEAVGEEAGGVASNPKFVALTNVVDVTNDEEVHAAVVAAARGLGRIDYAVNAAGIAEHAPASVADLAASEFDRVTAVNLRGVFAAMKAELRVMSAQDLRAAMPRRPAERGTVISMLSAASRIALPGLPAYTTAKHALVGLVKSAAVEHAPDAIRVNGVSPGWIETPLTAGLLAQPGGRQKLESTCVMKRLGSTAEVADLVLFLSSPRASFITGQNISVDGGMALV